MAVLYLLFALASVAAPRPQSKLETSRLEALHAQRIEWMKRRVALPPLGVYQDFRAVLIHQREPAISRADLAKAAALADVHAIFSDEPTGRTTEGVLFAGPPGDGFLGTEIFRRDGSDAAEWRRLRGKLRDYPDETLGAKADVDTGLLAKWDHENAAQSVTGFTWSDPPPGVSYEIAFRNTSTHILARELTESEVRNSLVHGHAYVAQDWLCDPAGFFFIAENSLGVFDMGDTVGTGPVAGQTQLRAYVPVPAKLKLIRDGAVVAEVVDSKLSYTVKEQGAYRLEAWLRAGGEDRPWIFSNPIYIRGTAELQPPSEVTSSTVDVERDVPYTDSSPADDDKHRLDLYLPKDRTGFPVLLFVHGDAWRTGDRSLYHALGNRFARDGIAVAIPSYRLMPRDPHPAQIEDVAAAFAWVYHNIARYGGDVNRLYVSGHSAGGQLVSLLALDRKWLAKYGIPGSAIHGVISISGIYDLRNVPSYLDDGDRNDASPLRYVSPSAPPFLIGYCQWDYLAFPKHARDFDAELRRSFVESELVYIPGENHVSETNALAEDANPLMSAILGFVK